MFKVILYLWLILTAVLVGITVWFIFNAIKKRFGKKDSEQYSRSSEKYISSDDMQKEDSESIQREAEILANDEKVYENMQNNESEPMVIAEEVLVQNIGDIDGDGKDDYIVEHKIVATQEDNMVNKDESDEVSQPSVITQNIEESISEDNKMKENIPVRSYEVASEIDEIEIPKNIDANVNIGQGHSREDIVRDKFEKHVQKIRYDATILKQRNDILGYEKKLVEGLTVLPNDIDFEKQLADLYFHQGKYKKAQSLLKKIITDNPEDHNTLRQMGEISSEDKQENDDAFAYLNQAYTLCDDNPKYCYSLAQWYYDHDDLQAALPLLEKITKLRPKNIDYLVSLSHLQHKIGDREGAKQSILRALELDPMNITLKQYLKSL